MPTEVIGEVGMVTFDPDAETIVLDGEYGRYEFVADETTRERLRRTMDVLEEAADGE